MTPMIHRASIVARLVAALFAAQTFPAGSAPIPLPNSPVVQLPGASPAQGKVVEGLKALNAGDLAAAEAAFTEAARVDPKLSGAYIGLAEVAGRQDKPARVEYWLKQALTADPNSAMMQRVWGRHQFQRGRFVEAEAAFKKAIALDPRSSDAQLNLAENYLFGLKKAKPAEAAYRAAIALDAGSAQAHLGLAATLGALGQPDAALAEYEQAAKLAPADPKFTHALARFQASQGRFDQALVAQQKTIAIAPDFFPAYIDLGDLYLVKNDLEQAAAAYRAGAKVTKNPATALFKLGTVLEGQQRWAEAEQAYLDAVKSDPTMYSAYNNLAFMAAVRKERLDDALAWAKKAVELAPKVTTTQDTLGWVYRARGELGPAAQALEKAVAANPKKASFRYHLGVVYAEQGKKKEAVAALQKALELDKNFNNAADAKQRLQQLVAK